MIKLTRWSSMLIASTVAGAALIAPASARASEEGRRNTALGLGAAAAYLLLTKKDKVPGLVAAGAAAWAYKNYDDAFRARKDRERYYGYRYGGDYRYDRYDRDRYNGDRYYRSRRSYDDDGRRYYRARYDEPRGWSRGKKNGWHKHNKKCRH